MNDEDDWLKYNIYGISIKYRIELNVCNEWKDVLNEKVMDGLVK